jgi:hypothetical protein
MGNFAGIFWHPWPSWPNVAYTPASGCAPTPTASPSTWPADCCPGTLGWPQGWPCTSTGTNAPPPSLPPKRPSCTKGPSLQKCHGRLGGWPHPYHLPAQMEAKAFHLVGLLPGKQLPPGSHAAKGADSVGHRGPAKARLAWDLGANQGRFSQIALEAGARQVVAMDSDHQVAEALFTCPGPGPLTLVMDLANPSPTWDGCCKSGHPCWKGARPIACWPWPSSTTWP